MGCEHPKQWLNLLCHYNTAAHFLNCYTNVSAGLVQHTESQMMQFTVTHVYKMQDGCLDLFQMCVRKKNNMMFLEQRISEFVVVNFGQRST